MLLNCIDFLDFGDYITGLSTESEKDGKPRNQVHAEGFKSEEGWHEIFNILFYFFMIWHLNLNAKS